MRLGSRIVTGLAVLIAALGVCGVARAETTSELASSPAQRCLFPAVDDRAKPVYPAEMLARKQGYTVKAEFVFKGPAESPSVRISSYSSDPFDAAIEDYARQLRVPCMHAGDPPVRLSQDFVFEPNDGRKVAWTAPVDEANAGRAKLTACITQPSAYQISYPSDLLRAGRDANVVARLHFFDAKSAPTFEVLFDGGSKAVTRSVKPFIDELRMPCLGAEPIDVNYMFQFRIDGGGSFKGHVLKDLQFTDFLHAVKPFPRGSVFFDTTTMKCPFDVRLTLRQPFEPNKVQGLEEDVPERHALLDWMSGLQFNFDPTLSAEMTGQQMTVSVPCARIDL